MNEICENMTVTILEDEEMKQKHGGYTYLIHMNYASHHAFRTEEGFVNWMQERGLQVGEQITHLYNTWIINGKYQEICLYAIEPHLPDCSNVYNIRSWTAEDLNQFGQKNNLRKSVILSNGDYTTCYIFEGTAWNRPNEIFNTIYYLNPNCKREIHDYKKYGWR